MLDLSYSLIIEATDDPAFFGFYSPDLEGFSASDIRLKIVCIRLDGE